MEANAGKGTSRSQNNVKKFKIPKNKLGKPELSNDSTTATYTLAISNIDSSVVSENKQKESSNVTNTSTAATPTMSTPESFIDFDFEKTSHFIKGNAENSESDKAKSKQTKLSSYFAQK